MSQETGDTKESNKDAPRKKIKPELIFGLLFVALILGAIGAMMYIDSVGEQRIGDMSKLHDAADH